MEGEVFNDLNAIRCGKNMPGESEVKKICRPKMLCEALIQPPLIIECSLILCSINLLNCNSKHQQCHLCGEDLPPQYVDVMLECPLM